MQQEVLEHIPMLGLDNLLVCSDTCEALASTKPYLSALFKRSSLPLATTASVCYDNIKFNDYYYELILTESREFQATEFTSSRRLLKALMTF